MIYSTDMLVDPLGYMTKEQFLKHWEALESRREDWQKSPIKFFFGLSRKGTPTVLISMYADGFDKYDTYHIARPNYSLLPYKHVEGKKISGSPITKKISGEFEDIDKIFENNKTVLCYQWCGAYQ